MALIYCPECRSPVSEVAAACPHCGYAIAAPARVSTGPTSAASSVSGPQMLIAGAGLLVLIGSFLPWATASAPLLGTINKAGTSGDGVITAVAGVVLILAAFARWRVFAGVLAVIAGAVALIDLVDIQRTLAGIDSDLVIAGPGIGIWIVLAGAVLGLAGTIMGRDL